VHRHAVEYSTYPRGPRSGPADLGWTVGRNVRIDLRWAGDDINRIRALAHELVGLQPDIIVTVTTPATVALQRETRTRRRQRSTNDANDANDAWSQSRVAAGNGIAPRQTSDAPRASSFVSFFLFDLFEPE
jgi:hypothetical protein